MSVSFAASGLVGGTAETLDRRRLDLADALAGDVPAVPDSGPGEMRASPAHEDELLVAHREHVEVAGEKTLLDGSGRFVLVGGPRAIDASIGEVLKTSDERCATCQAVVVVGVAVLCGPSESGLDSCLPGRERAAEGTARWTSCPASPQGSSAHVAVVSVEDEKGRFCLHRTIATELGDGACRGSTRAALEGRADRTEGAPPSPAA